MTGAMDSYFGFMSQALTLRADRQQVLAGNLANADTPHYHAVDFDFAKALQASLANQSGAEQLTLTDPRHQRLPGDSPVTGLLFQRPATQPSIDGNTVDANAERARFADNAIHYEAVLEFLNLHIKQVQMALQPTQG